MKKRTIVHQNISKNKLNIQESSIRKSVVLQKKRFIGTEVKFDLISMLPSEILLKILIYVIDGFRRYLCVNPSWYISITNSFDEYFNK